MYEIEWKYKITKKQSSEFATKIKNLGFKQDTDSDLTEVFFDVQKSHIREGFNFTRVRIKSNTEPQVERKEWIRVGSEELRKETNIAPPTMHKHRITYKGTIDGRLATIAIDNLTADGKSKYFMEVEVLTEESKYSWPIGKTILNWVKLNFGPLKMVHSGYFDMYMSTQAMNNLDEEDQLNIALSYYHRSQLDYTGGEGESYLSQVHAIQTGILWIADLYRELGLSKEVEDALGDFYIEGWDSFYEDSGPRSFYDKNEYFDECYDILQTQDINDQVTRLCWYKFYYCMAKIWHNLPDFYAAHLPKENILPPKVYEVNNPFPDYPIPKVILDSISLEELLKRGDRVYQMQIDLGQINYISSNLYWTIRYISGLNSFKQINQSIDDFYNKPTVKKILVQTGNLYESNNIYDSVYNKIKDLGDTEYARSLWRGFREYMEHIWVQLPAFYMAHKLEDRIKVPENYYLDKPFPQYPIPFDID